jgi:3-oxoacyl-[acyl-carrier protein] reductase
MIDLSGKIALVTGVGPNIGQQIAKTLARGGAAVVCNDLHEEQAKTVAAAITASGGKAIAIAGDVTNAADVERMLGAAEAAFGLADVLVNNAFFLTRVAGLTTITIDDWHRTIETILTGTFLTSRAFARRLLAAKKPGAIVNLGSTSGHRGRANAIAYSAAKGGILNMTRSMAIELAPHGIRVNSASPTRTIPVGELPEGDHASPESVPLGRLGTPDDIAEAIAFLVSDHARFITGEDLRVDGGTQATWGSLTRAEVQL